MWRGLWLGIAPGVAVAGGLAGWLGVERLESRNEFCVACHLAPQTPLHREIFDGLHSSPAGSLAAAHRVADAAFRCIDCHGGTGLLGRARVKLVSARDALMYLVGRFGEPERMRAPLWDEDCTKCHAPDPSEGPDAFHGIDDHDVGLDRACVACHEAHPGERSAEVGFLDREVVLPICRDCHEEF